MPLLLLLNRLILPARRHSHQQPSASCLLCPIFWLSHIFVASIQPLSYFMLPWWCNSRNILVINLKNIKVLTQYNSIRSSKPNTLSDFTTQYRRVRLDLTILTELPSVNWVWRDSGSGRWMPLETKTKGCARLWTGYTQ